MNDLQAIRVYTRVYLKAIVSIVSHGEPILSCKEMAIRAITMIKLESSFRYAAISVLISTKFRESLTNVM